MESGTPASTSVNQTPVAEVRLQAPGTGTGNWTVFRTVHMPAYAPTDAQRVKFQRLASQWRRDTLLSSSIGEDHAHIAHLAILAMGKPALPLILEELERNGGHWFLALRLIAEYDPVRPEHAGKISKMREDWIRWGRQNDFL